MKTPRFALTVSTEFEKLFAERKGSEEVKSNLVSAGSRVQSTSSLTWGQTSMSVPASMEDVAAALWDFESRSNFEISGDVHRKIIKADGINSSVLRGCFEATVEHRQRLDTGKHFHIHRDRFFKSKMEMRRTDVDTIVLLVKPDVDAGQPARSESRRSSFAILTSSVKFRKAPLMAPHTISKEANGAVQGKETFGFRLQRNRKGWTDVDFAIELDFGFSTITAFQDTKLDSLRHRLEYLSKMSIYFKRIIPLDDLSLEREDGKR